MTSCIFIRILKDAMYKLLIVFWCSTTLVFGQFDYEKQVLEILCSSEFGGRGYVNSGDSLAAEFIAAEFEKSGLKKIKKSYFQHFSFPINTFPDEVLLEINNKRLSPGSDFFVHPASGGGNKTSTTKVFTITDIFSGVFAEHIEAIKKRTFIPVFDPENNTNRDTLNALRQLTESLTEFTPVILLKTSKLTWSLAQRQYKHPLFEVKKEVFEDGGIHFVVDAVVKQHNARNVIAELPSTGKTKKTIVFTAHYDHLGRMGQDTYFPGANDNASGTTMLFSLARKLSENPSKNTRYVFIAFAGEEVGLLGSGHFAQKPLIPLNKITFLINLDILGGAQENITVVNGTVFEKEFNTLVELNQKGGYLPEIKKRTPTQNSDHHWFFAKGVPCFYIYSGGHNKHYHVPEDHAVDVDLESYMQIRDLLLAFVKTF
jgi:aminopeptidase YwaD